MELRHLLAGTSHFIQRLTNLGSPSATAWAAGWSATHSFFQAPTRIAQQRSCVTPTRGAFRHCLSSGLALRVCVGNCHTSRCRAFAQSFPGCVLLWPRLLRAISAAAANHTQHNGRYCRKSQVLATRSL